MSEKNEGGELVTLDGAGQGDKEVEERENGSQ